jgi:outer membrane protein OmpA-like peptidoglycan-associated protein
MPLSHKKLASHLACALLLGGLVWPGAPALAESVTSDQILRALTGPPRTRGLTASEQPAPADQKFIESLRHRTRSLTLSDRERITPILEQRPSVDIEIYFDFDSAKIAGLAEPDVTNLGVALTDSKLKGALIMLSGHTDAKGTDEYNQKLSERRAEAVKRYLVEKFQLPAENLLTAGYGKAVLKNGTDPLAAENRRVQIVNLNSTTDAGH